MRFFFVPEAPPSLTGPWRPPPELAQHLRALRLQRDEPFLLLLPLGGAVRARWDGRDGLLLDGLAEIPRLQLMPATLATAWPAGPRADELVVRAAEAGVERIVPLHCERSSPTPRAFSAARLARWEKLIREACEQCGRPVLPTLEPRLHALAEIRQEAPLAHPVALVPGAWPLITELTLHAPRDVLLLVGPEGGFSPAERQLFRSQGIHEAGLLPTVLRVESAGPAAVAFCQHWFLQTQAN